MAKEPWQMTKPEYREWIEGEHKRRSGKSIEEQVAITTAQLKSGRHDVDPETIRQSLIGYGWHEEQIKEALKAGKPVPAEVLKDYPDLARREESKPKEAMVKIPYGTPAYQTFLQTEVPESALRSRIEFQEKQERHWREAAKDPKWNWGGTNTAKEQADAYRKNIDSMKSLLPKPESKGKVVVTSEYKGEQLKAIHAYYDDMEDGHLDYKRPVSNRKPRITPRMPKLR